MNIDTDIDGTNVINISIDVKLIFRAFTNEDVDEFYLPYGSVLGRDEDTILLYVRRDVKHGRKMWGKRNTFALFIRRF